MKKSYAWIFFVIMLLMLLLVFVLGYYFYTVQKETSSRETNNTITIATWNLNILGDSKEADPEMMNFYAQTLNNFDIIFVQEIRDKDGTAFETLCSMMPDYKCNVSSRAGRTSSKEQYGIIYLKDIELVYLLDFNPDYLDRWERPPIKVWFSKDSYDFTVYNIHTKPDDTKKEITYLEELVYGEVYAESVKGNIFVLGDLNADCNYYPARKDFLEWNWIISDDEDTTSSNSDCAYDRIIMNKDAYAEYVTHGIFDQGITPNISDHYIAWVRIKDSENIIKSII